MVVDIKQYQEESYATNSDIYQPPFGLKDIDILHAAIGISTEAGELLDPFKKNMFYGKPLDYVNLDEEVGDILWYVALYATARGTTIERLAERNLAKLKHRYPNKFTQFDAEVENRDLEGEREILERRDVV